MAPEKVKNSSSFSTFMIISNSNNRDHMSNRAENLAYLVHL